MEKCKTIQTVDFESVMRDFEKDIRESEHITKTYVLKKINDIKGSLITYGETEPFTIPSFLNKMP